MGALALAQSRVPTKPMPPIELEFSIVIEVADDMIEGLARYHEAVARALRAKGKVTLSVR